ncbi:MAG: HAMP domain-containing sensor histidine kinase [Candidatus Dormibacteria bacterium]
MSGFGRALRSLRWRLTLTYLVLIAVLLAGLGAFQYVSLRGSLIDARVQALSGDLVAAQRLYASGDLSSATTAARVRTLGTLIRSASGQSVTVALFGARGVLRVVVPAGATPPKLGPLTFDTILADGTPSHQIVASDLVAGFPVGVDDPSLVRTTAVVEVSEPMAPIDSILSGDVTGLAVGGGVLLLLVLLVGLLLTNRALRPLRRLTVTAGQLASGDLRARSQLFPRDDEVGQLAGAFDHMADRIEVAFAVQQDSENRVRRFIADASHELRTPVTALSGYIEVLRRGAAQSPEAMDAALGMMSREADRLRVLVLDLLTLARLDSRQQQPEDFDLAAAVGRLLDEGVPGMPPRVDRDLPRTPVMVHGDRGAIATIVRNLLTNACKYAPGARQVWSVRVDAKRARVDAHDDGPGIPASDLPHIFERFYRGEKTRSREEGGSGLGLAIVLGLARAQGGDVAIASAEGAGTTVTFWLPLAGAGS